MSLAEITQIICCLGIISIAYYIFRRKSKFEDFHNNIKHNKTKYYWIEDNYLIKIRDFVVFRNVSKMYTSDGSITCINEDVFTWYKKNKHKILEESKAKEKYPEWLI